jgi:hypothetical protein
VSPPDQPGAGEPGSSSLDLRHMRREIRTALELAIVAMAPSALLDQLAGCAGLLEALAELPPDAPPVVAVVTGLVERARSALVQWTKWQAVHLGKATA